MEKEKKGSGGVGMINLIIKLLNKLKWWNYRLSMPY